MRLQLKTRKKDGNILTRIYYCPCGNGEIVEDQVRTFRYRVLWSLRRYLPQDQVEQPRLQVNGMAMR